MIGRELLEDIVNNFSLRLSRKQMKYHFVKAFFKDFMKKNDFK